MKDRHHIKAVTLIELLVACAIVVIVLVAHMGIIGQSRILQHRASVRTSLTLAVHSEMEKLRATSFDDLIVGEKEFFVEKIPDTEGRIIISETENENLKKCEVGAVHHGMWGDEQISLCMLRGKKDEI